MMRFFLGREPDREERVIEIRLSEQKARMYDAAGNEIFVTKVSTGRKGYATPTGEYVITNKYRNWTSTLYDASMPYFQRFSCGDFGLHQGNVPGYPASHGCIRVPAGTAAKLFSMTQTGDRVVILP
jgi:lipoprotein-anchoring transpeptidase ErfK/SrfK